MPPPPRIRSYGVASPAGSNPTMWPPQRDRILQSGPSRRIESYGVAPHPRDRILRCGPSHMINSLGTGKGQGHGQGLSTVAPPGGSGFSLWPLQQDRTFHSGPSRGIGLSDVAPPGGSDFLMWPLPQNRILRCGPPHGIDCHTVGSFEYSLRACCCL